MKLTQTPNITNKQYEILKLLYSHRFLTRIHIQKLLNHKDKKTINLWLKDLREKEYITWIYKKEHFAEKTKPAIYYLSTKGVRHLRSTGFYQHSELSKRYREHERSQTFIDRCLTIADCCLDLDDARDEDSWPPTWYFYETDADYQDESYYHFLTDSELVRPQLCFCKMKYESGEPESIESYLLEIFDSTLPRYRLRNRLKKYAEYLDEEMEAWDKATNDIDPYPTILLVCATLTDLIYAKRRTRGLMAEIWERDDEVRPHIRFTTIERLKERGILNKEIWEEA